VPRRDDQLDHAVADSGVDDPAVQGVDSSTPVAERIEFVVNAVLDVDGLDVAGCHCRRLEGHRQRIVVGEHEDGAAIRHGAMMTKPHWLGVRAVVLVDDLAICVGRR
jgi:hypothetical protein